MNDHTDLGPRDSFIAGLVELAIFLESNPDVPAPYSADVYVFPPDGADEEKRAEIDAIAARTGAQIRDSDSGHYTASLAFGPVEYRAVAICQPRNRDGQKERDET
jgi:hypothetical protein